MAGSDMDAVRAWAESPEGFPIVADIMVRMVFSPDALPYMNADILDAIKAAYRERQTGLSDDDLVEIREYVKTYNITPNRSHDHGYNDPMYHIAGYVPVLLDEIERLQGVVREWTDDPLLTSPDLPPLPWSSAADRQPWPNEAPFEKYLKDANGVPVLGPRNWKEACAGMEYLVRAANRGTRVIPK